MQTLNIVLYLDGSSTARRATSYLAPLAADPTVQITLLVDQQHEDQAESLFSNAETMLQAAQPVKRSIRGTTPERAIVLETRACNADLVVFGPLRREGWQRWLGQPSMGALARRLRTSILLMRGRPNELRRALICAAGGKPVIDDSTMTSQLLGRVHGQATILHILSQLPLRFSREDPREENFSEQVLEATSHVRQNIEQAKKILEDQHVDAKVRIRVGMVVEEIKEELRVGGYDLLVIGAHHMSTPLDRVLFEDVSAELLTDSPIPVLLVRHD